MKTFIFTLIAILSLDSYSQCVLKTASSAPNKLCYNYDKAGNRIAQVPSWLDTEDPFYCTRVDCTPNDPDATSSSFRNRILYPPLSHNEFMTTFYRDPNYFGQGGALISMEGMGWADDGGHVWVGVIYERTVQDPIHNIIVNPLEVRLYPNPNVGQFRIDQKGFDVENTQIKIYDIKGRLVYDREFINGEVNISELWAGSYVLVIKDKSNQESIKFIKNE